MNGPIIPLGEGGPDTSREAERALLRRCHLSRDTAGLVRELIAYFPALTGCEAVGIRLKQGFDFPYFTTVGFSETFVAAERSLCVLDASGRPRLDDRGNPVLACMCGNVLCGRVDPSQPFFTEGGTFWTNSTSALLAATTRAAGDTPTRGRCTAEGYESIALVPIRSAGRTFGLVQFNDRRPNRFSAEMIATLEHLCDLIAIAIAKYDVEEALRLSEERYRIVADNTYDWEFWIAPDNRVIYMSPSCLRVTGYSVEAFLADPDLRRGIVAPECQEAWDRHGEACHRAGVGGLAVFRVVRADGESRWIEHVCQPVRAQSGRLMGIRGSDRDVTDRRLAEEARDRAEADRERLIAELTETLAHVKTLRGFIPICSSCKKIRDDAGYWQAVEVYVRDHSEAEFTHGLCPACMARMYPGMAADDGSER